MTKATEMARVSAKGGFNLLWGLVASTVISAVGTIIIARLLGPNNYGLYAIALTAPTLISTFRDWGINTAMVKYSAQYNSENNVAKIRSIFVSGVLFEIVLGLLLSILSFVLSHFLALSLNRPAIAPLIQIGSFFILAGALVNAAIAAFTGMEKMHLYSFMLIIQSIIKTGLIVTLVVLGFGTLGAISGFTVASLLAGLTGMLLVWTMYKSLPKPTRSKLEIMVNIKTMFKYGLPLSIGNILTGFLTIFYSYILAFYVINNSIIGNYNVALNFVVLITFFATPVTTMLFPAFSKLDPQKDKELLKNVFQYSIKYAALVVVPVTAMVIALAQPAIGTIFADKYVQAPLYLALLSVTYLYTAFGNLSASNMINGQGYTTYNLKLTILQAAIGFPLSFVLISRFGVIGLIITTLTASLPSLFIGLRFIKRHFEVSVDWLSSAKILFSSIVTAVLTYILISHLVFSSPIQLLIGVIVFVVVLVFVVVVTRTVNRADVSNLREIINALGPLRKPLRFLLNLIEKLMTLLHT
ncbi:MAG: flippase [Candidatus Bathyarchaeia archaeon]|jgi:O-antigen/teichoic acid export membrane protein